MIFQDFCDRTQSEFVEGSGISFDLFQTSVRLVRDLEYGVGGEVYTPIHDALNWRYTRFGHQARESIYAALLLNEDGSTWQAKLSTPRTGSKGKTQKYETPLGNGSRAYLPEVPTKIRKLIGERYGVSVPLTGSFWSWLEKHPEISIVWTEGGKKALCLLSQGFVSIALYGVNGGYRRQIDDSRVLISDVALFAQEGRSHLLAFDQDSTADTRRKVNVAIARFGGLLEASGGKVAVTSWDAKQGKGVDDLIVGGGVSAFESSYIQALKLPHWRIAQRFERKLTYPAQVRLVASDLSTLKLESLPESGIVGIVSAKGTGKTKFIKTLAENQEKVLSATHRIALGRNLCTRLGLSWRGDLDKHQGNFIAGSGYTLRVGFCVDSLLAIDPEKFRGCDLVLDEVVQVVRHLLTSSTCAREGKRPALLARFKELIQVARRVVAADADLDNVTLSYLQELREEPDEPIFLIRNDFQSEGYAVTFIDSPDQTAISKEILEAVKSLELGKVVFVATDSKATSKKLAALIRKECPEKRVLIINSETSGGDLEREFMEAPGKALEDGLYDVIICSPSMATGVSIEVQGAIAKVYGIFTGVSATDADMSQALSRVREGVERIVWCAKTGRNYSKISRSSNFLEVKSHLQQTTSAIVRLVRSGLKQDIAEGIEGFDYQTNPHVNLFCRISAEQNFSMMHLRDALMVRLKVEGNRIEVRTQGVDPSIKLLLKEIREEIKLTEALSLVEASDLSLTEILQMEQKEVTSPEEQRAIAKFYLKEFYGLDELTVDDALWDNQGRKRAEILSLELLRVPELAFEKTVRALEKQNAWGKGICPWDMPTQELRRAMLERLGMNELIDRIISGWEWTRHDLKPFADLARRYSEQVKKVLHFSIHEGVSDTQIIHQLLSQLGIKLKFRWSSSAPGHQGKKLRLYSLDQAEWETVRGVLTRRASKRETFDGAGSPPLLIDSYRGGDLSSNPQVSSYLELLPEALRYGEDAMLELWGGIEDREVKERLLQTLPVGLLLLLAG